MRVFSFLAQKLRHAEFDIRFFNLIKLLAFFAQKLTGEHLKTSNLKTVQTHHPKTPADEINKNIPHPTLIKNESIKNIDAKSFQKQKHQYKKHRLKFISSGLVF